MGSPNLLTLGPATPERDGTGEIKYLCYCACGGTKLLTKRAFRKGKTKSCGCLQRTYSQPGPANPLWQGGKAPRDRTYEHGVWRKMHERCTNPNHPKFMRYGGRGITVDPRWATYEAFIADMGPRPSPAHSLDRIDNDGPYTPDNCRWATAAQQAANKRPISVWRVRGMKLTITQIATVLGRSPDALQDYLEAATARGQSVEDALLPMLR